MSNRLAPALGFLALAASFVVGADVLGSREALFGSATPPPRAEAFRPVDRSATGAPKSVLRSQPWWQQVGRYRGARSGAAAPLRIGADAIEWRATWSCQGGRFVVRSPGWSRPLIDAPCGRSRDALLAERPSGAVQVEADGPWTLRVEQQVDVPLVEPPLAAMTAAGASTIATGDFYRVDQVGRGRVTVYRLANGRNALRLRNFYVTPNVDLEIRLSPVRTPRSTREYRSAPSRLAAPLDVTMGSMNFVMPAGVDLRRYNSVVIWCPLITSAYAAATLDGYRSPAERAP